MLPPGIYQQKDKIVDYLQKLGLPLAKNFDLMLEAFVHKSYANDFTDSFDYNERLEFLGDSVLGFVVAKNLYLQFPDYQESLLSAYKVALVREETLAETAIEIGLDKMIFLGKGEEKTGGRGKNAILADSLEALIGYIYLDLGEKEVEKFIKKFIYPKLHNLSNLNIKSYKTILQEYTQKNYKNIPKYENIEFKKDNKGNVLEYKAVVYVNLKACGEGFGSNKKRAQEEAAQNACNFFNLLNEK